jgi:hypothetical protein
LAESPEAQGYWIAIAQLWFELAQKAEGQSTTAIDPLLIDAANRAFRKGH